MSKTQRYKPTVMATTGILFALMIVFIVVDAKTFYHILNNLVMVNMMDKLGWFVNLVMLFFVAICIILLFHPIGKIKLGGPNAKPKFSYLTWFGISLCTGIGAGVVFWGAAEPLLFAMEPAPSFGYAAGSNEAILWSMRTCFLHWGLTPYASCVVMGVILSYVCLNKNAPFKCSSALIPIFGEKVLESKWADAFDSLSAFALTGAVAGGLGYGILQLSQGVKAFLGVEPSTTTYVAVLLFMFLLYNASALSGLKRGITWLSNWNTELFFFLLIFLFLFGPLSYICNLFTESLGAYVGNFFQASTYTAPYVNGANWPQNWDMYWWVDWLAYAPLLGLFMVRVAYGRTLREFILVEWLFPAIFGVVWFAIFGGTVLHAQFFEGIDFYTLYKTSGAETLTLAVFDTVPLSSLVKGIMLFVITISLVTQCDSMVVTLSGMCMTETHYDKEAPWILKLFWGLCFAVIALAFTMLGGIDGVKTIKSFCGFPMAFICLFITIGFLRYILKRPRTATGEFVYEDEVANKPDNGEEPIPPSKLMLKLMAVFRKGK